MEPLLKGRRLPSAILATGAAVAMMLAGLGIAAAQTDDSPPTSNTAPPSKSENGQGEDGGDGRHRKGRHGDGRHCHKGRGVHFGVAAKALGITPAELKRELSAGKSIADVARARGVDIAVVVEALVADAKSRLAERVAAGDLTQQEADAKIANLTERITSMVNASRPFDGRKGEREHDGGGDGHKRRGDGEHAKAHLGAAAAVLNLTPEELRAELRNGKSLATIAAEKGVDAQKVIDAIVAAATVRLDEAVSAGRMTQAEADEKKATMAERVAAFVNAARR